MMGEGMRTAGEISSATTSPSPGTHGTRETRPLFVAGIGREHRRIVGLMSGTSVDGVDAALVELTRTSRGLNCQLLAFETVPLDGDLRRQILTLCAPEARVEELGRVHMALGETLADAALGVMRTAGLAPAQVDLIGSHGQTVRHLPMGPWPSTLQIGEPAIIAQRTGIVTVADFRPADMAAGGQGAPLVPLADYLLCADAHESRLLLNLGGIANITVLPAGATLGEISAFDLGPANGPLDAAVQQSTGGTEHCDVDGLRARRGTCDPELLRELLEHPFLSRRPPKSTGREEFGAAFVSSLRRRHQLATDDLVATLTAFSVHSIARGIRRFVFPAGAVAGMWVAGGGLRNPEFMRLLRAALPELSVASTAELGVDPDAREAIAFAVLAGETVDGRPGNVPYATGATRATVLGKIVLP